MGLNLAVERRLLKFSLRAAIEKIDPELQEAASRLPQRIGRDSQETRWVTGFSDITMLYPLLITEDLPPLALDRRTYLLPHALLVLYAHLDDRRRDRQIDAVPCEEALADWLLSEACRCLEVAVGGGSHFGTTQMLLAEYAAAQAARASDPTDLARLVVCRHLPGLVSSVCLLQASRCGEERIERMVRGFRHLVLSLQWIDDLRDIEEDLATGADNLLLARVPRPILTTASPLQLIGWLHEVGLLVLAIEESHRHLAAACSIALTTACPSLVGLLQPRQRRLRKLLRHAQGTTELVASHSRS